MLFLGLLAHKILREIRASSLSEKGDKRREAEDTLIESLAPVPTYASSLGSIRLYCSADASGIPIGYMGVGRGATLPGL